MMKQDNDNRIWGKYMNDTAVSHMMPQGEMGDALTNTL